jgi:hypothetical protein
VSEYMGAALMSASVEELRAELARREKSDAAARAAYAAFAGWVDAMVWEFLSPAAQDTWRRVARAAKAAR